MDEKRASRISVHRGAGLKVNSGSFSDKAVEKATTDDRFARLFNDPLMAVDKGSDAFKRMRPNARITQEDSDEEGEGEGEGDVGEEYDEVDDDAMDIEAQRAKMLADIEAGEYDDVGMSGDSDEDEGSDDEKDEKPKPGTRRRFELGVKADFEIY